jgi:acyl-CoA synthetase (AMP-forming)/AMP-acid ligase II
MIEAAATDNRKRNLGYFFDGSVGRFPDKICIIDLHGECKRNSTYAELDQRMSRVASMLGRLGVSPGERVGIWSATALSSLSSSSAPCARARFRYRSTPGWHRRR